MRKWHSFYGIRTTASKATGRRRKVRIIPTATRNSAISTQQVKRALARGMPVISVDTKKKELLGNYDNGGKQWLPAKKSVKVNGHDFPSPEVPRAYPYGIYDLARNTGFVNVGMDHDPGHSRSHPSGGGGVVKADHCIRRHGCCSSRRMVGVAMAHGCGSGN